MMVPRRAAPAAAGLAPRFLDGADANRLVHMLRHGRGAGIIVQLIAATSGEGTSSLARDLALTAARTPGQRVLLLDLDPPGNGQFAALCDGFGIPVTGGRKLLEPIRMRPTVPRRPRAAPPENMRQENAIREGAGQEMPGGDVLAHQLAGLDLYVSETRVPPPTGAAGWIALFPTLRENFELILIDSPPLERSQDGILLSLDVDTNLLVVRAERTQARVARDLRDRILDMGGPISGVVLNQRREHIPAALRRYV